MVVLNKFSGHRLAGDLLRQRPLRPPPPPLPPGASPNGASFNLGRQHQLSMLQKKVLISPLNFKRCQSVHIDYPLMCDVSLK